MPGRGSTLRIGRLAGVPIGVHPLWLVIVALLTLALGDSNFPTEAPGLSDGVAYLLGLLSALALFAGILLHELGHAIVARRHGLEVEEIDLWLLGGVARISGEPREPGDELRFALPARCGSSPCPGTRRDRSPERIRRTRSNAGHMRADWEGGSRTADRRRLRARR